MEDHNRLLPIGTLLNDGKYRVEEHLASGGFGNTYKVVDVAFEEHLAMKEFFLKGVTERDSNNTTISVSNADNTPEFISQKEKFRKEAQRLRKLKNDHVVRVYDLFEENGTAYYTMDFLEGESLAARMKKAGHPFDESQVIDYTLQVLDALDTVHAENIWHLDLKPGNIMTDGQGRAVLIDFGASKQYYDADGRSLSTSTGLCYTPGYAPTEQIESNAARMGPWTDLYALGATIYNLLTKKTPPSVSDIQDGEGFEFPDTVSPEMQGMVRWMMNPDRKKRPQSVADVWRYMENRLGVVPAATNPATVAATQRPSTAPPTKIARPAPLQSPSKPKWPWIVGGLAGVALLLVIGIGIAAFFIIKNANTTSGSDYSSYDEFETIDSIALVDQAKEPVFEDESAEEEALQAEAQERERQQAEEAQRKQEEAMRKAEAQQKERDAQQRAEEEAAARERERQERLAAEELARKAASEDNTVFDVVEVMPRFPGGDAALMSWLGQNVHYPVVAEENGIQGRVICTFVVERDGSISEVKVVKNVDPSLDKEAVRVIRSMPKWVPGKQNGKAVRVKYTLPVTFRLQ